MEKHELIKITADTLWSIKENIHKPYPSLGDLKHKIDKEFGTVSDEDYQQLVRVVEAAVDRGNSFLNSNGWDDAIEEYEKAISLDHYNTEALNGLCIAYEASWHELPTFYKRNKITHYCELLLAIDPKNQKASNILIQTKKQGFRLWIFMPQYRPYWRLVRRWLPRLVTVGALVWLYLNYEIEVKKYVNDFFKKAKETTQETLQKDNPLAQKDKVVLEGVIFDIGQTTLNSSSKVALEKIIRYLKENKNLNGEIAGHTDNSGDPYSNQQLSEARAKAVYDYLINEGIETARLHYKGYGDKEPIADNNSEINRAKNRRIEFRKK